MHPMNPEIFVGRCLFPHNHCFIREYVHAQTCSQQQERQEPPGVWDPAAWCVAIRVRADHSVDCHCLRQLVGSSQNGRSGTIDPHEEVPALGHIQPVRNVPTKSVRSEKHGERAVGIQLHVRGIDDVVLVLHEAVVAVHGDGPESVVFRHLVGSLVADLWIMTPAVVQVGGVPFGKKPPCGRCSDVTGLFVNLTARSLHPLPTAVLRSAIPGRPENPKKWGLGEGGLREVSC